jgi:hypothetical protein
MRVRGLIPAVCLLALFLTPTSGAAQPAEFFMNFRSTLNFTLTLKDVNGNTMFNTQLNNIHLLHDAVAGGHHHPLCSGSTCHILGRINRTSCTTGWDGNQCPVEITSGPTGGIMRVSGTIANGPSAGQTFIMVQPINVSTNGGHNLHARMNDLPGPFVLVGDRPWHPDNHWCRQDFCDRLIHLAVSYKDATDLELAYNDSSLIKGGTFDVNQNWYIPHRAHQEGRNQDVRANGGPNSIPSDPATRLWFENQVLLIFGPQPSDWHEDIGGGNEHYHITG